MKKGILVITTLCLCATTFAQENTDQHPKGTYEYYIQKKKANNTTGWILLSGGLLLSMTGMVIELGNMFEPGKTQDKTGQVISYTGLTAWLEVFLVLLLLEKTKRKPW